jgi:hypothetical protein
MNTVREGEMRNAANFVAVLLACCVVVLSFIPLTSNDYTGLRKLQ